MPWKISSKHYKKGKKEGKHKRKKQQSSCSFDSLVVFGDSLSDTGTGLLEFPCNDPSTGIPCLQRTTDGRVFVEYLAELVVPFLNPGGLTIGDPGFQVPDDSPVSLVPGGSNFAQRAAYARNPVQDPRDPSLATQVSRYAISIGIQPATGFLPPTRSSISPVTGYVPQISLALPTQAGRLHVVEVGANDILEASTVYWTSQMGLSTGASSP